jgi:chloride channel protein, CIC family
LGPEDREPRQTAAGWIDRITVMAEPQPELTAEQVDAVVDSKGFIRLLVLAAVIGLGVSLVAWGFLEGIYQMQEELFVHIPSDLGYHNGPPLWEMLLVLGIAGAIAAFAIVRLPGRGGHIPVNGLSTGKPTQPIEVPGILLAAIASIGGGLVLGPEAPLIAMGGGLALWTLSLARRETPPTVPLVIAAAGSFAGLSFLFGSPIVAAVIMIEASGIGGPKAKLILLPGLLAAGIGSLVSIGLGSLTGLSTSAFTLGPLPLPTFSQPSVPDFAWTIPLAIVITVVVVKVIIPIGRAVMRPAATRAFVILPIVGVIVAVLAVVFTQISGHTTNAVILSGQDALPKLISQASSWSVGALALLIICKGIAWGLSLGSFRGGPTFPAIFLGTAAGLMVAGLPGFSTTPSVAVGLTAGTVAMLRLPLTAVVLGLILTSKTGLGVLPLIIVAAVVAYITTTALSRPKQAQAGTETKGQEPTVTRVAAPST